MEKEVQILIEGWQEEYITNEEFIKRMIFHGYRKLPEPINIFNKKPIILNGITFEGYEETFTCPPGWIIGYGRKIRTGWTGYTLSLEGGLGKAIPY